jgi:hypothetical protein
MASKRGRDWDEHSCIEVESRFPKRSMNINYGHSISSRYGSIQWCSLSHYQVQTTNDTNPLASHTNEPSETKVSNSVGSLALDMGFPELSLSECDRESIIEDLDEDVCYGMVGSHI